jgi:hypothetical protein
MTLYRSANGKMVDMTKLAQQNELTPAVGNAGVNARGDKLGSGGAIIEHREVAASQYHKIPKKTVDPQPVVEKTIENFDAVKPASSAPAVVAPAKSSKDKQ